jgi:indole-3-glycerol phosphate synthase
MNILETIAAQKRNEVTRAKQQMPVEWFEKSQFFASKPVSLVSSLLSSGSSGIIAEFKRKSPSKGLINGRATVAEVTAGYLRAGAAGLSVLTDHPFFGGSNDDLLAARRVSNSPILRKDFIIDPYQVYEARSIGADAILLIAAILTPEETLNLAALARSLGMETILEVHGKEELSHFNDQINIIGVNNRNLADFRVSLDISLSLAGLLPKGIPAVSESGIYEATDIIRLKEAGYTGFLIGERFMSEADPAKACEVFISKLNRS